jgi:hypothetical protein
VIGVSDCFFIPTSFLFRLAKGETRPDGGAGSRDVGNLQVRFPGSRFQVPGNERNEKGRCSCSLADFYVTPRNLRGDIRSENIKVNSRKKMVDNDHLWMMVKNCKDLLS